MLRTPQDRAGQSGKAPKTSNPGFWAVLDEDGQILALAEAQSIPLCTLSSPHPWAPHLGLFSLGFGLQNSVMQSRPQEKRPDLMKAGGRGVSGWDAAASAALCGF